MKRMCLLVLGVLLLILVGGLWFLQERPIMTNSIVPKSNTNNVSVTKPNNTAEVVVAAPQENESIQSPLRIDGRAKGTWFFEANLPIVVLDANGNELGRVGATAQGEWMTTNTVPFSGEIAFTDPPTATGILRVMKDNPSGLPENDAHFDVPIAFADYGKDTTNIRVFFGNSVQNPNAQDCSLVYGVNRAIPKTQAVARAALEALLSGPTQKEKDRGYYTSVNSGIAVQKLTTENGVARVDFDTAFEKAVGGSCRVTAIWSQIEKTLLQFPTVKSVIISVDGRTEDILQP